MVGVGPNNHQYLATKRDRMGHVIDEDDLTDALGADARRSRAHERQGRAPIVGDVDGTGPEGRHRRRARGTT